MVVDPSINDVDLFDNEMCQRDMEGIKKTQSECGLETSLFIMNKCNSEKTILPHRTLARKLVNELESVASIIGYDLKNHIHIVLSNKTD